MSLSHPFRRPAWSGLALLAALTLTAPGCAEKPVLHRGWVGGEVQPVRPDDGAWLRPDRPVLSHDAVAGTPREAMGHGGLLVLEAHPETPLGRAGLVPGDLLIASGEALLEEPEDLWEAAERAGVGGDLPLTVWRAGETRELAVLVGDESYRRGGSVSIGLALNGRMDLWPFDDGIDLLGLVVVAGDSRRIQTTGVRGDYVRSLADGEQARARSQESFTFRIVPIGIRTHTEVLGQSAGGD